MRSLRQSDLNIVNLSPNAEMLSVYLNICDTDISKIYLTVSNGHHCHGEHHDGVVYGYNGYIEHHGFHGNSYPCTPIHHRYGYNFYQWDYPIGGGWHYNERSQPWNGWLHEAGNTPIMHRDHMSHHNIQGIDLPCVGVDENGLYQFYIDDKIRALKNGRYNCVVRSGSKVIGLFQIDIDYVGSYLSDVSQSAENQEVIIENNIHNDNLNCEDNSNVNCGCWL